MISFAYETAVYRSGLRYASWSERPLYDRFRNRRALGGYVGLGGTPYYLQRRQ